MHAKSLAPAYERSKTSNRQTTRRTRRFALCCELLESRQLLSVGQASLSAGAAMNLSIATPQTSVPAAVAVSVPSGLSNNTEFGFATSGSLSSTGSLGAANPTNSANASIFTEANVNGSSVNSGDNAPGLALDSNLAVSPLNPNNTSIAESTRELEPDQTNFIIPPPTLIVASVQLGGSSSPATAISAGSNTTNSSAITLALPAQPTSAGQLSPSQIIQRGSVSLEGLSVIEQPEPGPQILEPAPAPVPAEAPNPDAQPDPTVNPPTNQPPAPVNGPEGQPQPAPPATDTPSQAEQRATTPDDTKAQTLPVTHESEVDAGLDSTNARPSTRLRADKVVYADDKLAASDTSRSFSVVFGAVTVAMGGYNFAAREANRFKGRWTPRWVGIERPIKTKKGSRSR
jgi:hypothetical protein